MQSAPCELVTEIAIRKLKILCAKLCGSVDERKNV